MHGVWVWLHHWPLGVTDLENPTRLPLSFTAGDDWEVYHDEPDDAV